MDNVKLVELSGFWRSCNAGGVDLLVSGDGGHLKGNRADGNDNWPDQKL